MGALPLLPTDPAYNKAYQVVITGNDESGNPIGYNGSGSIVASLPEQFDLMTTSEWAPIFPSGANVLGVAAGLAGLGNYGALASATISGTSGYSTQLPLFSQLFWVNTSPLSFTLNLQFNAVNDAKAEVMGNIESLVLLTLPSLDSSGFLRAPGPTLITSLLPGLSTSKYAINMSIGKAWLFSNVLIQDVHATVDTMPTSTGDYISANVQVRVSTNRIYTKQDMQKAFQNQPQDQPTFGSQIGQEAATVAGAAKQPLQNAFPKLFPNNGSTVGGT